MRQLLSRPKTGAPFERRERDVLLLVAIVAALVAAPTSTRAQSFAVDQFDAPYAAGTSALTALYSDVVPAWMPSIGITFHGSSGLLRETIVEGGEETTTDVLGTVQRLDVGLGFGIADILDLGVVVPLALTQDVSGTTLVPSVGPSSGFELHDVRLATRIRPFARTASGFGLALAATVFVPTGDDVGTFSTDGAVRVEPRLVLDWRTAAGFGITGNIGYQVRPKRTSHNLVSDDTLRYSVAVEVPLGHPDVRLTVNLFGAKSIADNLDPQDLTQVASDSYATPLELLGGIRAEIPGTGLILNAGGGLGVIDGAGAPNFRYFAGLSYVPDLGPATDTLDGPDTDGDGIIDALDQCPAELEDMDRFDDTDGCPEPDNDKDGLLDEVDACPDLAEDLDGFEDNDGCPELDNDKDGVADAVDRCPTEPEDRDGDRDDDGCPEETATTADPTPGGAAVVKLQPREVRLNDQLFFEEGSSVIDEVGQQVLDDIAAVMARFLEIETVQLTGHSAKGEHRALTLDRERAEAVRDYLAQRGILLTRLTVVTRGISDPLTSNDVPNSRASNRRVGVKLVQVNGETVDGVGTVWEAAK